MSAEIRSVDVNGPDLKHYAEIIHDGLRQEWGDRAQQRSVEDFRVEAVDSGLDVRFFLMWIDDLPVGTAEIVLHHPDHERVAWVHVRTRHEFRGFQIGQKLLRHCEQIASEYDCDVIRGTSAARSVRDDRNTRFLKKSGYTEVQRVLRQDMDFPNATFDAIPPVQDDSVEPFVISGVPELSLCEALVRLDAAAMAESDSPFNASGSLYSNDANALQARLRGYVESGRFVQLAGLRSNDTGEVVGCTELQYRDGDALAEQFESFILPAYRTHAADVLLRQASLRALLAAYPNVPTLRAFTPEAQQHTIELKREIGYRDIAWYRDWERALK